MVFAPLESFFNPSNIQNTIDIVYRVLTLFQSLTEFICLKESVLLKGRLKDLQCFIFTWWNSHLHSDSL